MLMERGLTINKFVCGRWFLSLIALLLMSVGMQAENYGITVAGVEVTDANAGNITGANITAGTVSFEPQTSTLTLNNVSMNGNVVSSLAALNVKLVGVSTFNIDNSDGNRHYLFYSNNSSATLTFSADELGATLQGYGTTNNYKLDLEYWFDVAYDNEDYWSATTTQMDDKDYCQVSKPYVIVDGSAINDANKNNPDISGVSFDLTNNKVTLSGFQRENQSYNSYSLITSNIANLNVDIQGGLNCIYLNTTKTNEEITSRGFVYTGASGQVSSLNVTVAEGSKLLLSWSEQTATTNWLLEGFSQTNMALDKTKMQEAGVLAEAGVPYDFQMTISNYTPPVSYGITVAGVEVNSENASNITGDNITAGTVSFNPQTNTLTLNNASIRAYDAPIVSGLENLTVFLVGENTIYGGSHTFSKTSAVEAMTLTFTTDEESMGSLFINNLQQNLFGEGVTPVYSNVFIKHEGDSHTIDCLLGVRVGGVEVTPFNKDDVLGDGKVSYDAETSTLTLNGATIGNDGSDDEPMEACGIDYTGTADLTICLKGTNTIYGMGGCEAIRYNGNGDAAPKLIFTKGDNQTCSLQLNTNTDYERTAISGGFSEIEGVWGVGTTDNGLAIIADNEVKYDSEEGLTIKQVVNYIANYVPLSSTQIASYYGLTISGVPVYEGNKGNITGEGIYGDGTASFEPRTNTLTLNNVNLNPDYAQNDGDLRVSIVTSLAQLNINLIGESQTYAIKTTNENSTLTFKSAEENRGAARLNFWYNADPYFIGFGEDKVTYNDGLCMREDSYNSSFPMIVALNVPKVITNEKERGLYFPDHVFTFALEEEIEGFDIYYANMLGGDPVKTTDGTFSLGTGRYVLNVYPIYPGMDTDPGRNWQYSSEIYAKVIEKPTFSVDASSVYNDDITVFLQNIPEQGTTSVWDDNLQENIEMPQVWYYIDDNKTDSVRYDATKGIPVTESCKVSAYILDEDSGRVVKSIPVEAEYTVISKTQLNISYAQNSREWASYCASENSLETPDGLQAYVVKQATKTGVQVEAIDYIPQGVGVLLKRTAEVAEPIVAKAYMEAEPEAPTNKLVGTTTSTSVRTLKGSVYVLYNDGFTRATSGAIGANRGYLLFDETVAAGARLSIFEDETTAVENVNRETLTNNQYYNLNGQRVVAPKKNGLYIVNGQKKIVK